MSDRIAVMHGGRIEQVGTPEDLYDRPQTPFVADFIGTTNLLSGVVAAVRDETAVIRLDSGDRCIAGAEGCVPGKAVQLSVRPESIRLDPVVADSPAAIASGSPGSIGLRGAIEQVAYLGSAVQYHVRTAGGLAVSVLASRSGQRFESGDTVVLAWSPTDALLLGDRTAELEESA